MSFNLSWEGLTANDWLDLDAAEWGQLLGDAVESCCPATNVDVPFTIRTGGRCRSFLERELLLAADRLPMPRMAPRLLRTHRVPVQRPVPLPPLQEHLIGIPPTDRAQTLNWPFPERPVNP